MPSTMIEMSSSVSLTTDKKDINFNAHFSWRSMRKFIYTAHTYSTDIYNFDLFSKIVTKVRIFDFVFCEITIGMAYMFMDCFMKQYTRRQDSHKYLNPLLKGITYGLFLQTALWAVLHANYVAASMRFLASSLQDVPSWCTCHFNSNLSCVSSKDVLRGCQDDMPTNFTSTSAHFFYTKSFKHLDRGVSTTRFFVVGLVWILNFCISTVTDEILLKIFKLTFACRVCSTFIIAIFMLMTTKKEAMPALVHILNANSEIHLDASVEHITYTFGIGFLGFYEFTSLSPYTMVDNAVVIFMFLFTTFTFLRSWIIRTLYETLTKCVIVEISLTPHSFLFAILPLSTQFLYAHKLYSLYIYLNLIVSTIAYLTMLTLTMSKLLHTEFRSLKNIYIVGILCFLGFGFSLPLAVGLPISHRVRGLIAGLNVTVLYLGGFKVAVVMWVYGVQKFSTDIHFWLGFKPTKFWKLSWVLLPLVLSYFLVIRIHKLTLEKDLRFTTSAVIWISLSVIITFVFHVKTIVKYLMRNNLPGAFSSSIKYGPPEPEDRKRRRYFNETIHLRQCQHNCHVLDDTFDCNHLPLMQTISSKMSVTSEPSMLDIFEEGPSNKPRPSIVLDIESHH